MKRGVVLILSCLFLSMGYAVAQKQISGSVVDDTGDAVIGASVVVKGTTIGTSTDLDGNFTISLPEERKHLIFSLVGMTRVEHLAKDGMKVVMSDDAQALEEVIVTGYGSYKKSSFTGSASTLSTKNLENVPGVSLESRLAGAAAGV